MKNSSNLCGAKLHNYNHTEPDYDPVAEEA